MKRYLGGFDLLWFAFIIPFGLVFVMIWAVANGPKDSQASHTSFGNAQELTVRQATSVRASACEGFELTVNAVLVPTPQEQAIPEVLRQVQPFSDCGPKLLITPPFDLKVGDLMELKSGSEVYINVVDGQEAFFSRRLNQASRNEINSTFLWAGVALVTVLAIFSRLNGLLYQKYLDSLKQQSYS